MKETFNVKLINQVDPCRILNIISILNVYISVKFSKSVFKV